VAGCDGAPAIYFRLKIVLSITLSAPAPKRRDRARTPRPLLPK
jgi:hypothetical protein